LNGVICVNTWLSDLLVANIQLVVAIVSPTQQYPVEGVPIWFHEMSRILELLRCDLLWLRAWLVVPFAALRKSQSGQNGERWLQKSGLGKVIWV
jgi:hypothetical protein